MTIAQEKQDLPIMMAAEKPDFVLETKKCPAEGLLEHRRSADPYSSGPLITDFPKWLRINLCICDTTVGLMFVVALVNLAFASIIRTDLEDDTYDYSCESNYIRDASQPADGTSWTRSTQGQYHDQCRRLYLTSFVLITAGSFSMLRAIPVCFFPVQTPSRLSIRYKPSGLLDRLTTPARIYAMRTFFSTVPAALYLFGIISISTSRFMTGPRAEDSYKTMYVVCLALLGFSTVTSIHQALTTAYAGLLWSYWRQSTT